MEIDEDLEKIEKLVNIVFKSKEDEIIELDIANANSMYRIISEFEKIKYTAETLATELEIHKRTVDVLATDLYERSNIEARPEICNKVCDANNACKDCVIEWAKNKVLKDLIESRQ